MSTWGRLAVLVAGLWLGLAHCPGWFFCNDVPPVAIPYYAQLRNDPLERKFLAYWVASCFLVSVVVEYLVILAFLGWPTNAWKELFFWIPSPL